MRQIKKLRKLKPKLSIHLRDNKRVQSRLKTKLK